MIILVLKNGPPDPLVYKFQITVPSYGPSYGCDVRPVAPTIPAHVKIRYPVLRLVFDEFLFEKINHIRVYDID
jgi:hypothetical protein